MTRSDSLVRAVWQGNADEMFFLSQARHAFGLAIKALDVERDGAPVVWFPDYFSEISLAAARRSGATIVFYPVTGDLAPDWDACRELAARRRPALFVLVHYFAQRAEVDRARAFCDEIGAFLFEDATHVLRPQGAIGLHGDLVCYSPRKYFAIPDGGLLAVRGRDLARRLGQVARLVPRARAPAAAWLASRLVRNVKLAMANGQPPRRPLPPTTMGADPAAVAPAPWVWMSDYSRWRLGQLIRSGRSDEIAGARLDAHLRLSARLARLGDMRAIDTTGDLVPYWTVMRCGGEQSAARHLNGLRALGARVNTWPGLPPEVTADPLRHRAAMLLRRTLLRFTLDSGDGHSPTEFLERLPAPPDLR